MLLNRFFTVAMLAFSVAGCQVATVVDNRYADSFSAFDSPVEKIIKLEAAREFDDAALIYDQHKAAIADSEDIQAINLIKSQVGVLYRSSMEKLKLVGSRPQFLEVESSIGDARDLSDDYDEFAESLGLERLVAWHSAELSSATATHKNLLSKEIELFLASGEMPDYSTISMLKGVTGGKWNAARKKALNRCKSLRIANDTALAAYRCLNLGAAIHSESAESTEDLDSTSFWAAIEEVKKDSTETNVDIMGLSKSDLTELLKFYQFQLNVTTDHGVKSPEKLVPQDRSTVFVLVERASIAERSESQEKSSSYLLRTDRLPNRNYQRARRQYQYAMQQKQNCLNNYYAQAASNPYAINLCGLHAIPIAKARNELSSTPQYVKDKVYEDYSFFINEAEVLVDWRVTISALDSEDNPKAITFTESASKTFKFAKGLHPKDRRHKKYKYKTEEDVSEFVNEEPEIEFNELISNIVTGDLVKLSSISDLRPSAGAFNKIDAPDIDNETPGDDKILSNSIVIVSTRNGSGAGFYISDSFILTNEHVVNKSTTVKVTSRQNKSSTAVVLAKDKSKDLALLVVTDMPGESLTLSDKRPSTGEEVRAYGHPSGYEFSVTRGIVSALRSIDLPESVTGAKGNYVQSDVAVSPGNSGGPLIQDGKVIGVITFKDALQSSEGLSFSLSSNEVLAWIDSLNIDGL